MSRQAVAWASSSSRGLSRNGIDTRSASRPCARSAPTSSRDQDLGAAADERRLAFEDEDALHRHIRSWWFSGGPQVEIRAINIEAKIKRMNGT